MRFRSAGIFMLCVASAGCAALGYDDPPGHPKVNIMDTNTVRFQFSAPEMKPLKPYGGDGTVFGLSVSGGGARAAAFTMGVLVGLEEITIEIGSEGERISALDKIDFSTSVSGGSWAIAAYLADRVECKKDIEQTKGCSPYSLRERRPDIFKRLAQTTSAGSPSEEIRDFIEVLALNVSFNDIAGEDFFDPFFQAAITPAQAPFFFSEDYFEGYRIKDITIGNYKEEFTSDGTSFEDLTLGIAAFVSGAVPGWYEAIVHTDYCVSKRPEQPQVRPVDKNNRSECSNKGDKLGSFRLQDGGVFDNYGYHAAFELMNAEGNVAEGSPQDEPNKLLLQIDTTTNNPFYLGEMKTRTGIKRLLSDFWSIGRRGTFFVQDEHFRRTFAPFACEMGISTVNLDFYSTMEMSQIEVSRYVTDHERPLSHLQERVEHDKDIVSYTTDRGDDRARNNYWRTGMAHMVTFEFGYSEDDEKTNNSDIVMSTYELGILAARRHADIIKTQFDKVKLPDNCAVLNLPRPLRREQ